MSAHDALVTFAARQSTSVLFEALDVLAASPSTPETRLSAAAMSTVLEERHNLGDAMDAIYADEDYAGTYTEALHAAYAATRKV